MTFIPFFSFVLNIFGWELITLPACKCLIGCSVYLSQNTKGSISISRNYEKRKGNAIELKFIDKICKSKYMSPIENKDVYQRSNNNPIINFYVIYFINFIYKFNLAYL